MAPEVFTDDAYRYIEEHLRILSGFYGVLRPFDGVTPYRLEMQARLGTAEVDSLYRFWGGRLADKLFEEADCILNLASKEYSRCVKEYLQAGRQIHHLRLRPAGGRKDQREGHAVQDGAG